MANSATAPNPSVRKGSRAALPSSAFGCKGPFDNERLLGKALKGFRDRVVIATKFGFKIADHGVGVARIAGVDGRAEHVKEVADASLKRLGIDVIDIYFQPPRRPAGSDRGDGRRYGGIVQAGKVRALGLSEAAPTTISRAHAVHPISAVQSKVSLWTRDPEREVLPVCRELGIGFVPYSPLGRGFPDRHDPQSRPDRRVIRSGCRDGLCHVKQLGRENRSHRSARKGATSTN